MSKDIYWKTVKLPSTAQLNNQSIMIRKSEDRG